MLGEVPWGARLARMSDEISTCILIIFVSNLRYTCALREHQSRLSFGLTASRQNLLYGLRDYFSWREIVRIFFISLVLLLGQFTDADADTVEANFRSALQYSAENEPAKSAAAMQEAVADLRLKSPLSFAVTTFVDKPGSNYGMYHPRASNEFTADEKLRVYAEPIGYGWKKVGDVFQTHLVADAALLSSTGQVLWGQREFGEFKLASRHRFVEYMMNLTLSVSGVPKGQYTLEYTVTDKVLGNSAKMSMPFSIK